MADLTNNFGAYMQLPTFRFWCQHVIPLVYDDSLSYYEVLCKAVSYINNIITDLQTTQGNLTELAEACKESIEGVEDDMDDLRDSTNSQIEEIRTLVNSSLTGEYGGIRRKIVAITDSVRAAAQDERSQHLLIEKVYYDDYGIVDHIRLRIHNRELYIRVNPTMHATFGMINNVRGYNISLRAMYGDYTNMADSNWDGKIYVNGLLIDSTSLEDYFYDGRLINELTIYCKMNATCYIVTHINGDYVNINYKYDANNIPGANSSFTRNPCINIVSSDNPTWTQLIRDNGLQIAVSVNNGIVLITQDETFVADTWHKLQMQW